MSAVNCNDEDSNKITPEQEALLAQIQAEVAACGIDTKLPSTVAAAWDIYESQVIPITAPKVQREETKKAFYSGASLMLNLVLNTLNEAPEDECVKILGRLNKEMVDYYTKVLAPLHPEKSTISKATSMLSEVMGQNPFKPQ